MKKHLMLFSLLFALGLGSLCAQEVTVTGQVTSAEDGLALPGVNIRIKDSNNGTETDFDGNYSIEASKGQTLVFSYIGMKSQEIVVAETNQLNVQLEEDAAQLDAVIVTALGIKKSKKTLTYSAQDIKNDELTRVRDANPINTLAGKVAGIAINNSASGVGGSVKVTIRGNASTSNNQPLYVIDGIPMLNSNGSQPNSIFGANSTGNRDGGDAVSLLNPDDIESMTVLKGSSASVLYGNQGANGVILITTKSGKAGKPKVVVSSNTTSETVLIKPELQYSYAAEDGSEFSWGDAQSSADHVDDFFDNGLTQITNVSLSLGSERMQHYISYSNTTANGIMPTNNLHKHNINLKETAKFLDNRMDLAVGVTLSSQQIDNKPISGLYFNPLTGLYLFPRGNNYAEYANNFETFDMSRNLNAQNWPVDRDIEQNPNWILNRNKTLDQNQRVFGSAVLGFQATDWLSLKTKLSLDRIDNKYERMIYATTQGTLAHTSGRYILAEDTSTQYYADFIASMNKKLSESFDITSNLGTSVMDSRLNDGLTLDSGLNGGLIITNLFSASNLAVTNGIQDNIGTRRQIQSVFGNVQVGYNDWLFADISGRNDWSSTLVNSGNSSFFYPSFGLTAVISDIPSISLPEEISFMKFRLSHAEVGNDLPAYLTSTPRFTVNQGNITNPVIGLRPGDTVEPENQKSIEFGTELKFFNNRLGMEFTYYDSATENQFVAIDAPDTNSSGLLQYGINAGSIENKGVEIALYATPVKTKDFAWETNFNYAKNDNTVVELDDEIGSRLILTNGVAENNGYNYVLEEGKPFGIIEARSLVRNEAGQIVLDADGNLQVGDIGEVGNAIPDFTLGWSNSFNYKNFSLNLHIDGRFGGDVVSVTEAMADSFGVSQRSADARNAGGVAVNAVDANGNAVSRIDAQTYYTTIGGRAGALGEYVYDATNVRLRELALGYTFNLKDSAIKHANISLIGRNLFFFDKEAPFDPNVALSTGEGLQGIDVFGLPSTRSLGVNLSLTF